MNSKTPTQQHFSPNMDDILHRVSRRRASTRLRAGFIGLVVVGLMATAVVVSLPNERNRRGSAEADKPALARSLVSPLPEGSLAWREGNEIAFAAASSGGAVLLEVDMNPLALAPDGRTVLGTRGVQLSSGPYRQTEMVLLDLTSGRVDQLLSAGDDEGFAGPVTFSPDGSAVAYRRVQWDSASPGEFQGGPTQEVPCIVTLSSRTERCFGAISGARSLSWLDDARGLLVTTGAGAVAMLNAASGAETVVVPADLNSDLERALRQSGIEEPTGVEMAEVDASPSGDYFAAMALVDSDVGFEGAVPLIYDLSGRLVAHGVRNHDAIVMAWSPDGMTLAYSAGVIGIKSESPQEYGVRTIDVGTANDMLLLDTSDIPNTESSSDPFIFAIDWSPSGEWLIAQGREQMWMTNGPGDRVRLVDFPEDGALVGWEG